MPAQQRGDLPPAVVNALDTLIAGPSIYDKSLFSAVDLSPGVPALAQAGILDDRDRASLNRALLEDAFPIALAVAALAVADATVQLERVTVLGRIVAQRLSSSNSIMRDFAAVKDAQDGCVRFSAYASGSMIASPYESVSITAHAPLFTSDSFGHPGYAQLLDGADAAIIAGSGASISSGAENGSEMGAFCADLNPLKDQGLLVKYTEYMPLGLAPVIVHVT